MPFVHSQFSLLTSRVAALAALFFQVPFNPVMAAGLRDVDVSMLPEPVSKTVRYFGDIHPILAEHCIGCHGPDKQKGGLRLDSRDAALKGGEAYGPAIIAGKSAESPLVHFMAHLEADMEMPPNEDMRPARELALLRAWIDQGAKWPQPAGGEAVSTLGNQELFFQQAEEHWAYQPVPKLASFGVKDAGMGLSAKVDDYVEEGWVENGLTPAPMASPRVLIRRVFYDLTGLPPSMEQVSAFEADPSEAAYEKTVDALLESAQFGERWARYWLDIARYADTRDFVAQQDLRYPFAWTYRDYVVNAFNADKPYDQFIKEQLAADQLGLAPGDPAHAALGFVTVGPRFRGRTDEIINDRIDTVTRGLMGMTVSCARCHDHKFDPIRTEDFYALYGVFASITDSEQLPEIELEEGMPQAELRADYDAQLKEARAALADFVEGLKRKALEDIAAKPEVYFDGLKQMVVSRSADVRKLITGGKMKETALTPMSKAWERLRRESKYLKDPVLGPLARVAGASAARKAEIVEAMVKSGRIAGEETGVHPMVLAAMKEKRPKDDGEMLAMYGEVWAAAKGKPSDEAAAFEAALMGESGWLDFPVDEVESAHRLLGKGRGELAKLYEAIAEVDASHAGAPPRAMVVEEKPNPVTPVVFVRGDPARKGDSVERRFPEVLDPEMKPLNPKTSGRLELAEQIVDRTNPLTARVWANQVWRHVMGRSLVDSGGDFGLQAEEPSHPELLDLLAAGLMDRGWSTKGLIRDLVLSSTYRRSSAVSAEAAEKDPLNRFVSHANRRRMDFESMRDSMLAASGKLDLTMGGRAVDLSTEPFSVRRTLYGHVDRTNLDPLFTTFDFPSPDIANTERTQTTVPQQALFALNDGFIIDQARALAKAAEEQAGSPSGSVDWIYRRVFFRPPSQAESALAMNFIKDATMQRGRSLLGSWIYGFGSADPQVSARERLKRLGYFDPQAKRYQVGRVFPNPTFKHVSLTAAGGHPGDGINHAAIRRWVAPYDADIELVGELSVTRIGSGDGVRGRLISSRSGLLGEWVAEEVPVATVVERVPVKRGETLDFVVDSRESMSSDGFRWAPTLRLLIEAEEAPTGVQTVWVAQADFAAPAPPSLAPMEQLAHAMLMTNEFLFID